MGSLSIACSKILLRLLHALAGSLVPVIATLQVRLVCFRADLPRSSQTLFLFFSKSDVNLACDASHDGVLHGQHIFEFAVVTLGPNVGLITCLDELDRDAYTVRRASNAALDKIVSVQFLTDLLRSSVLPLYFATELRATTLSRSRFNFPT